MSYFSMSKSELEDCAARGDSAARQELARRRIKNNPDVVDAPAKAPKPKMDWAAYAARAAANKAKRRAKWSPAKKARMLIVQRVMNFAQHLIRENNWYPQAALKIAWAAEKDGHLSDYTLRGKAVVPADVIELLQSQALDPAFRKRGQPMQEEARMAANPRGRGGSGRGGQSRSAGTDFDCEGIEANPSRRGRGGKSRAAATDDPFDYGYGL
jgi:hypothetical protein